MLVGERKIGLVMVKARLLPRLRVMAGGAVGPQPPAVNIILAMAVDAGGRGLAIRSGGTVAGTARESHVRILQGEVRQIVRETCLAQLVDVGIAAQMLRVAAAALTRCGLLHPA